MEACRKDCDSARCPICRKAGDKKCSGCHKIYYCSSEHQKKHWKVHKNDCRNFIIKRNETYGRFLVATRDIPHGTIIFTEEPLAIGPKRSTCPICLGCHKRVDGSYRCSKCTYPVCSEICEKVNLLKDIPCFLLAAEVMVTLARLICVTGSHSRRKWMYNLSTRHASRRLENIQLWRNFSCVREHNPVTMSPAKREESSQVGKACHNGASQRITENWVGFVEQELCKRLQAASRLVQNEGWGGWGNHSFRYGLHWC